MSITLSALRKIIRHQSKIIQNKNEEIDQLQTALHYPPVHEQMTIPSQINDPIYTDEIINDEESEIKKIKYKKAQKMIKLKGKSTKQQKARARRFSNYEWSKLKSELFDVLKFRGYTLTQIKSLFKPIQLNNHSNIPNFTNNNKHVNMHEEIEYYINYIIKDGLQEQFTPNEISNKIKIPKNTKNILVLFNIEFLNRNTKYFITDSPKKLLIARAYFPNTISWFYSKENWKNNVEKIIEDIKMKIKTAPDLILTNPPYTRGKDLKIILTLHKYSLIKKIICVHPSTWAIDRKRIDPTYKIFRNIFEKHISDLILLPNANEIFDIDLFGIPAIITTINMNSQYSKIKVFEADKMWEVSSLDDVTIFGINWTSFVKHFFENIKNYCSEHGSIDDNLISYSEADPKQYHIQFAKIVHCYHKALLPKNVNVSKGIRKKTGGKTILQFITQQMRDNYITYFQTDFVRFCLYLLKVNGHIDTHDTALIPYMDPNKCWTDDKLFSELGYNRGDLIRDFVKQFIKNDYHNLYPNGKTY